MKNYPIYSMPMKNQRSQRLFDIVESDDGKSYLKLKRGKEIITVPLEYIRNQVRIINNHSKEVI